MPMRLDAVQVIYEDAALLVLDKPSGLLSVPGRGEDKQDCLSARVPRLFPDACVVHRLDMATSGLMLMARGPTVQRQLNDAFASRRVHKRYQAIVEGVFSPETEPGDWATIDLPIALDWPNRPRRIISTANGKPSMTRWRQLATCFTEATTRLELEPITGRSHQLRVHLQAIGHPILGDQLYAPQSVAHKVPRLLLHATRLELQHPVSQEPLCLMSQTPF